MDSQNTVYECSRQNASLKVSNSEWVNEWNDGIKLNKGDSVRLLGSFISEVGDGNDIAVSEDVKFTIDFKPYVNAETINFNSVTDEKIKGTFQMKLGDIAQPAYATDNFGIEPPYTSNYLQTVPQNPNKDFNKRQQADRFQYSRTYPNQVFQYKYYERDDAQKIGAYLDTTSGAGNITALDVTNEKLVTDTLSQFNQLNLPQEYYIAHMCKLVVLPLFHGTKFLVGAGVYQTNTFDPADVIQVGDYISTYHLAQYPTLATPDASEYTYTTDAGTDACKVKWEGGPQSVVGKVIATKYMTKIIYDPVLNQSAPMEFLMVYVQDFINPGQYKYENDLDGTKRAPRHGAPEKRNGYNNARNDNKTTGITPSFNRGGPMDGNNNDPTISAPLQGDYFLPIVNDFQITGGDFPTTGNQALHSDLIDPNFNMKGNTNQGLSFLWGNAGGTFKRFYYGGIDILQNVPYASSWVEFTSALTGVIADGFGRNQLAMTLGDKFLFVDSAFSFQELRTTYYNINSPCYTDSTAPFYIGNIENIEEVPLDPNFANQTAAHYYKISISAPLAGDYAINTIDFHYQRQLGGWDWLPKQGSMTTSDRTLNTPGDLNHVDSVNWVDMGGITNMNPDDDNQPYKAPTNPAFTKRFYIPYSEQSVESPYKARHYQDGPAFTGSVPVTYMTPAEQALHFYVNPVTGISQGACPTIRLRHIFGQSPSYGGEGDTRLNTNRTLPFPYFLNQNGANPDLLYTVNGYNDSNLSMHFQTTVGDCKFQEPTTDQDKTDKVWKEDLIYIKKYKTEFNIKAGFYEVNRMAEIINDQLHYSTDEYYEKVGINTNVGSRERNLTNSNNVIRGNFIHTYIPDISYGFLPLTPEAVTKLNNPNFSQSTTNSADSYLTSYDAVTGQTTSWDITQQEYYFVPYTHNQAGDKIPNTDTLTMFRFIGSVLGTEGITNDMKDISPSDLSDIRVHDAIANFYGTAPGPINDYHYIYYMTRTFKNRMMYGGASKNWIGAVNPTFEFSAEEMLYNFSFLYTPYRPAIDEDGSPLTLVGGLSVPSAIINSTGSGEITESLSGIYIQALAGSRINSTNTPSLFDLFPNNSYPPIISDYLTVGRNFWNSLGFSNSLLDSYGINTPSDPYIFINDNIVTGETVLRNRAEVDISANGSNPLKSYCSLWCPPVQFAIIVESNQKYGDRRPIFSQTPFYLIGSSFPSKQYYGGKGTKLPVMGVCSRQFSSFGFAFDLSESAITYTIDHDCTITSIHTKIYNNDYTIPKNLDANSSIIYVIERNNYYPSPTVQQLEAVQKEDEEESQPINYTPQMFAYTQPIDYEAPLYLIDSDDEDLE